jgi:SOUL heme-binding protein
MKLKTALLASFGVAASVVGASAVEEPPHQVVSHDGDFEIRDYPSMTVAETTVDADRNSAAYAGFRLLAGYIFGGNAKKQKIDMTAPVIEARSEYTLPTQAPGRGWVIRFVMPRGFSVANLPKPETEGIVLREEPPAHMAVLKFSGLASDGAVAAKTAELQAMLKARNLMPSGSPIIAQYDPPWTLPFLRRNEIMIPVQRK